ncbi:MAG: hypothetical protein A3H70_04390 [Candidatus Komeilibacteria bacterium RIFCSPLOWO2_02_FULL_48_11]|uniref:Small ribosomal subunit protein uS5 n=1 Tax=Candidatus Komeilibacteria bacterium RIFCSPLOWO2_02_FULL_48_11 TaxID=1798553 RepID=A0A1G2BT34_9BACT|nr:MAG: hypothetical protein A3H70_04390 [Candidatus Komeilibacteria bacterium RIFCSPLOWO2_02_FULL_48_11]
MANQRQSRQRRGRPGDEHDEFGQATIDLARVTRVMAGGKRMRFRACIAIGDKKGRIGLGVAKGADVALAITKATNDAKKNLTKIHITAEGSVPHQARIKWHSSKLLIKPAPVGTGIIAGSVLRQIFDLAGIRNVVGKVFGAPNKINNARALIKVLSEMKPPRERRSIKSGKEKTEPEADKTPNTK